jgi:hypothetical protein
MSYENAKANLKEFGKELNLTGLEFDENNTCILGIDNVFSLHFTYEQNSNRLYIYAPLLDGLPKDEKIRLKLYERLLEGSMLGGQMAGGGCGVAVKEELILIHAFLDMGLGVDAMALCRFAPLFVETVEKWRDIVAKICAGQEPEPFTLPIPGREALPPSPAAPGGKHPPSAPGTTPGGYIKI